MNQPVLQKELEKLDEWAKANNMEFNGKKFQVVRYGQNKELMNNTSIFLAHMRKLLKDLKQSEIWGCNFLMMQVSMNK